MFGLKETLFVGAFCALLGVVFGLVLGISGIAGRCTEGNEFIYKYQRYTCSPTGEWVSDE